MTIPRMPKAGTGAYQQALRRKRKPSALQKLRDEVLAITGVPVHGCDCFPCNQARKVRRVFARRAKRRGRK